MGTPATPGTAPPISVVQCRWLLGLLVLLAFATFPFAELFWDDYLVIREDGPIASLSTIGTALFGRCVLFSDAYDYPYYRPLIDILFILEYAVAGKHPFLYHLTNFVLHLGNVLLAFELFRRLAGGGRELAALLAAGVIAVHPIQCESVLWPAARPAVLCMFFVQLSWLCLLALTREPRPSSAEATAGRRPVFAVLAVGAYLLALGSKEIAVAAMPPFLVLLLHRDTRRQKLLLAAGGALVLAIAVYVWMNAAAAKSAQLVAQGSVPEQLTRMLQVFGFYLTSLLLPVNFMPAYPPLVYETGFHLGLGAMGALALMGVFAWGIYKRDATRLLAASGAALLGGGAVLPLLGGQIVAADRYMYQAMWGLGILIVMGAGAKREGLALPAAAKKAVIAGLVLLAVLSLKQSVYWISSDLLWARTVQLDPDNLEGNYYLGDSLERGGNHALAAEHYERAAFTERKSVSEYRFDSALAAGRARFMLNEYDSALRALDFAAQSPRLAAEVAVRRAIIYLEQGRSEECRAVIAEMEGVAGLAPGIYLNLTRLALMAEGDRAKAWRFYQQARAAGAAPVPELEELGAPESTLPPGDVP